MDPITALGAAAGGVQLVDVAARAVMASLKLVRELHGAPVRTAALLADVERSTSRILRISAALLQPATTFFENIPPDSFARLSSCAGQLRHAMDDLQQLLISLCNNGANTALSSTTGGVRKKGKTAVRKVWSAVVTVKKQEEVADMLARVDRLNLDMIRELEVVGLEMQATSGETAEAILQAVREGNDALSIGLGLLASGQEDMKRQLTQLHAQSEQVAQELRTGNSALVNDFVGMLTGGLTTISTQISREASWLAIDEKTELEYDVCRRLMQYPSSLREAHYNARMSRRKLRYCTCRPTSTCHRLRRLYGLEFTYETESDHRPSCPLHSTGLSSWLYVLRARLFPFVNQTVEFVLGATYGAGRWSLAPPLKFHATVRRADSPIFRIFDELPIKCTRSLSYDPRLANTGFALAFDNRSSGLGHQYVYLEWNPAVTLRHLGEAVLAIQKTTASGTASGADVDEHGNTMVFEIFYLSLLMGNQWELFSFQLQQLLHVALELGSDPWRRIRVNDCSSLRPFQRDGAVAMWAPFGATAIEYAVGTTGGVLRPRTPLLAQSKTLELLDSNSSMHYLQGKSCLMTDRSRILENVIEYPELAEGMWSFLLLDAPVALTHLTGAGYSDLEIAIIRRSLHDVQRLATAFSAGEAGRCTVLAPFSLLELALGWTEGLPYLVSLPLCPIYAILTACHREDVSSLRVLLGSPLPLFTSIGNICSHHESSNCAPETIHGWIFGKSPWRYSSTLAKHPSPYFRIVAAEFQRRREALNRVAVEVLSGKEREAFGLSSSGVLDGRAKEVYSIVTSRTAIPAWLDCAGTGSVYSYQGFPVEYLRLFHDAGFHSVDVPDEEGITPLLRCAVFSYEMVGWSVNLAENRAKTEFFLRQGASPLFSPSRSAYWPSLLFYLAAKEDRYALNLEVEERTRSILNQAHKMEDRCDCFCSDNGCIAPLLLWRYTPQNQGLGSRGRKYGERIRYFENYCTLCGLDETQFKKALAALCRAELFDRLGMAHTCCWDLEHRFLYDKEDRIAGQTHFRWELHSPEDWDGLRAENFEYARQLDLLMEEYGSASSSYKGSIKDLWNLWWRVVDSILPPLAEICLEVWDDHPDVVSKLRSQREVEALQSAGYGTELSFDEIIKSHFGKYRRVFYGEPWPENDNNGSMAHFSRGRVGYGGHFFFGESLVERSQELDITYGSGLWDYCGTCIGCKHLDID